MKEKNICISTLYLLTSQKMQQPRILLRMAYLCVDQKSKVAYHCNIYMLYCWTLHGFKIKSFSLKPIDHLK
jgi:hypothetical protein